MTTSDVERKLQEAVTNATPDMKKEIIEKCKNADNTNLVCFDYAKRSKREHRYAVLAIVAILIITGRILFSFVGDRINNFVITTIDIDVNPSIELQINKYDKVVKAEAINDDAIAILDGMDLHGVQTKIAVNAIVGSMFKQGYLVGNTDTVLISVDGKNKEIADKTKMTVTEDVDSLLKAYNSAASVISQEVGTDVEIKNIAKNYHISIGKATLIKKILDNSNEFALEDLVGLNISELHDIIDNISSLGIVNNTVVLVEESDVMVYISTNDINENVTATSNDKEDDKEVNSSEDTKSSDEVTNNTNKSDDKGNESLSQNKVPKQNKNDNVSKEKKNKKKNEDSSKNNKKKKNKTKNNDSNDASENDISINDVSENDVSENDISKNDINNI